MLRILLLNEDRVHTAHILSKMVFLLFCVFFCGISSEHSTEEFLAIFVDVCGVCIGGDKGSGRWKVKGTLMVKQEKAHMSKA